MAIFSLGSPVARLSPLRRAKALSSITLQILLAAACSRRALPGLPEGAGGGHLLAAAARGDGKRPWEVQPRMTESWGGAGSLPDPSGGPSLGRLCHGDTGVL